MLNRPVSDHPGGKRVEVGEEVLVGELLWGTSSTPLDGGGGFGRG